MPKSLRYTPEHAKSGLDASFPEIQCWPNQFPGYEIMIEDPEFTSICPKTGLPDFGVLTIRYLPDRRCLELKSLKEYLHSYRNLGIFQENIVNRVLEDVVRWARPVWAEVKGDFPPAWRNFHPSPGILAETKKEAPQFIGPDGSQSTQPDSFSTPVTRFEAPPHVIFHAK